MTRRRRRLAIVVGVALAAVVALVASVAWPRGTSDVTEQDAVAGFREQDTTASTVVDRAAAALPDPGVYVFEAEGEEVVKLGPMPAETRPLGEEVTGIVVHAGSGCFDWTISLFEQHTEDTRYCIDGDGDLRLDRHVKHQQIAALSPTATMTCDPDVLRVPGKSKAPLSCSLTLDGGPAKIAASLDGEAVVGEPEAVVVGDDEVDATPVTVTFEVSGDLEGAWEETTWWSEEHLPVRIERTLSLSGLASFDETSTLVLTDLEPST